MVLPCIQLTDNQQDDKAIYLLHHSSSKCYAIIQHKVVGSHRQWIPHNQDPMFCMNLVLGVHYITAISVLETPTEYFTQQIVIEYFLTYSGHIWYNGLLENH